MRDVTDNVTGELDVEVKRGRGRPRKADAMTGAQRQAAYRARKRNTVTVTENTPSPRLVVDQVDAYDECRLEVDALRAELAEAHEAIDEMTGELREQRQQEEFLQKELRKSGRRAANAEVELEKLRAELAAAKKGAGKSVTHNGKQVEDGLWLDALAEAVKGRKSAWRLEFSQSGPVRVIRDRLSTPMWNRLQVLCHGPAATQLDEDGEIVTRRA